MFARRRSAPPLVRHLESRLGPIETGWSTDPDGATMPFQIVRFTRGSHADDRAFGTLGLSRRRLKVLAATLPTSTETSTSTTTPTVTVTS